MQTPRQMTRIAFALAMVVAACSGAGKKTTGGTGGDGEEETGGTTSSGGTGGTVTTKKDAAAETATGGSSATGGAGGTVVASLDASAGGSGGGGTSGGSDAAPSADGGATTGPGPGGELGFYEAEAVPPNMLFGATKIGNCGAGTCPPGGLKEGMECCSGGKKLSQLLRGTGGAVLKEIAAPADGMYDVTWWFHCGKNDNFGDTGCGGLPHTASGCRPHVFTVNDMKIPGVYHFPCFPGSWGEIHASTVALPLKSGMNSIRVVATAGRDAADLDAIQIFPAGKGPMPKIPPTAK